MPNRHDGRAAGPLKPPPGALPKHPHLDDLDAISDDPHPRKTRRVEWVGEQSPYDNPVIAWNLLQGRYTEQQKQAIRLAAARARTRVCRERLLEHEHRYAQAVFKGLRRTYHWTKANNFVQDVDYADVDKILGSDVGHEFVDLDAREHDQPKVLTPPVEVVILSREEYAQYNDANDTGAIVGTHRR